MRILIYQLVITLLVFNGCVEKEVEVITKEPLVLQEYHVDKVIFEELHIEYTVQESNITG